MFVISILFSLVIILTVIIVIIMIHVCDKYDFHSCDNLNCFYCDNHDCFFLLSVWLFPHCFWSLDWIINQQSIQQIISVILILLLGCKRGAKNYLLHAGFVKSLLIADPKTPQVRTRSPSDKTPKHGLIKKLQPKSSIIDFQLSVDLLKESPLFDSFTYLK